MTLTANECDLIIGICAIPIIVLPMIFPESIHAISSNNTKKLGWVSIWVIIFALAGFLFSYKKNRVIDFDKHYEKVIQQLNQDQRDTNQVNYQKSLLEILSQIKNDTTRGTFLNVGQQGNSGKPKIEKPIIFTSPENEPVLFFPPSDSITFFALNEIKNDKYKFRITLQSKFASSSKFDLKYSFVTSFKDSNFAYVYLDKPFSILEKSSILPKDYLASNVFYIDKIFPFDMVYIWVRGTYKNLDGSKTYDFDNIEYHNMGTGTVGDIVGETRRIIIRLINQSEK